MDDMIISCSKHAQNTTIFQLCFSFKNLPVEKFHAWSIFDDSLHAHAVPLDGRVHGYDGPRPGGVDDHAHDIWGYGYGPKS